MPVSCRCQSSLLTQNQGYFFRNRLETQVQLPCAVFALPILGSWSFLVVIGAPAPLCFYPLRTEAASFSSFPSSSPLEFRAHQTLGLSLRGFLAVCAVVAGAVVAGAGDRHRP